MAYVHLAEYLTVTSRASWMGSCPPASFSGKCTLYRLVRPC